MHSDDPFNLQLEFHKVVLWVIQIQCEFNGRIRPVNLDLRFDCPNFRYITPLCVLISLIAPAFLRAKRKSGINRFGGTNNIRINNSTLFDVCGTAALQVRDHERFLMAFCGSAGPTFWRQKSNLDLGIFLDYVSLLLQFMALPPTFLTFSQLTQTDLQEHFVTSLRSFEVL